ncbi:hypothetical protein CA12_11420 [Alienimonas californiensis]|uniref:Uncharacterized protein n=2 Tax=Alienimonas californiensis TaxID=2527989 RepID=A0A517P6T9_9PLAN|nr:hypothetical protein CA12_11420 [Alienimonas californiensis]
MRSAIGWVDFSSEHRDRVRSVLDLLGGASVLDELGIGSIRDSFSDLLFPGLSTIQTRAKYFLTVPRILKEYEGLSRRERGKTPLAGYLPERERDVMESLCRNHSGDGEDYTRLGIVGSKFYGRDRDAQRKPSAVYWNGLRTFGLVRSDRSLAEFVRTFADPLREIGDLLTATDQNDPDDGGADAHEPRVLVADREDDDEGWIASVRLDLTAAEAGLLKRQIETRVPESLLGRLMLDDALRETFLGPLADLRFADLYDEPAFTDPLPADLRRDLRTAGDFWRLLEGAHVRYNVLLQPKGTPETRDEAEARWAAWRAGLDEFPWDRWETDRLWEAAARAKRAVKPFTRTFVTQWIRAVRAGADEAALDALVSRQERLNKGPRARLREGADGRVDDWVGIDRLEYRLPQARTMVRDVDDGLARAEPAGA